MRDAGFTFPEVVITSVVMAMLAAVLCAALVLTLIQRDNTEGRVNVAVAQQSLGLRLPNDLASAAVSSHAPGKLVLQWDNPDGGTTTVHYEHDADAGVVTRMACTDTCAAPVVVAHDVTDFAADTLAGVAIAIDGGGDVDGAGGGLNHVSLAAAVTERSQIDPTSTQNAPTLANLCAGGYLTEGCPVP